MESRVLQNCPRKSIMFSSAGCLWDQPVRAEPGSSLKALSKPISPLSVGFDRLVSQCFLSETERLPEGHSVVHALLWETALHTHLWACHCNTSLVVSFCQCTGGEDGAAPHAPHSALLLPVAGLLVSRAPHPLPATFLVVFKQIPDTVLFHS